MSKSIKKEFEAFRLLLSSVPPLLMTLFVMSIFSMNLLANKSIALPVDWLALDCGFIVSWFAFLTMDITTRHFGPKAASQLSVFALILNLAFCLLFFLGSRVPGAWGESFVEGSEDIINSALNNTFGGTWYVLAGSSLAFIVSALVNNFTNYGIGLILRSKKNTRLEYYLRSFISTAVGQFADNLIFAFTVSHIFFGWTSLQCVTCAVTGMLCETLCEVLFSPVGYKISENWRRQGLGMEYFAAVNGGKK